MKFFIVSASHRPQSQSGKVGAYVQRALSTDGHDADLLDLGKNPLPLWDEGVWQWNDTWQQAFGATRANLEQADALVLVTPEWGGMAAPALKNFLLLAGIKQVGHKPALLIAVSASKGGAYPLAEVRATGSKNNRLCFIPEHVIVRNAGKVLESEEPDSTEDGRTRSRISYGLKVLAQYATALKAVRESGVLDFEQFKNGM